LNKKINSLNEYSQYLSWLLVFLVAFSFTYLLQAFVFKNPVFRNKDFLLLLFIGPALFAWKMAFNFNFHFSDNEEMNMYWNHVTYWPLKLVILTAALFIIWKVFDYDQSFYGLTIKDFDPKPYVLMLLIMAPLIAAACTQPDFLTVYPKMKKIEDLSLIQGNGLYKLLYELSYGSDFISIELFFRGFLVLCFMKWAGKDAILPMALFYCTIHFGKPLGECISSFFGGLLLGIVTYNTRSIFGGLIVHLGIAWLMELGGYLGRMHF
jgi:Type II CAAX prenyl endopeptidase Rce1-like